MRKKWDRLIRSKIWHWTWSQILRLPPIFLFVCLGFDSHWIINRGCIPLSLPSLGRRKFVCLVLNWVGLLLLLRWWIQFVATSCPLLQSEEANDRLLIIKSWKFGVVPFSVLMLDKAFASLSVFTLGYCSLGCFWSVSFELLYPKESFCFKLTALC